MEITQEKQAEYVRRFLASRTRILSSNGFYGMLLMHLSFALDFSIDTAATDGSKIYFCPKFLDELNDRELDFVLMHELLHVVLKHVKRSEGMDHLTANIAADIVVNSNIYHENEDDLTSITLRNYGVSMHKTPYGTEGYAYTMEEVYEMLKKYQPKSGQSGNSKGKDDKKGSKDGNGQNKNKLNGNGASKKGASNVLGTGEWNDDHSKWDSANFDSEQWDRWTQQAAITIEIQNASRTCGPMPALAQRILKKLREPQLDWRELLNNFIQEEVVDYSFTPPDRRFDSSDFYLPDFNDLDTTVKKILFVIDTSGSMNDEMISDAYAEIKGAIDQYNGKLEGFLAFFDGAMTLPKPFDDVESLKKIPLLGGGGTNPEVIFKYLKTLDEDELPVSIIILTDGYFSIINDEKIALGIPVLWVINNKQQTPPWGRVVRISGDYQY